MTTTEEQAGPAARMGIQPGQVVQELGSAEDVDQDLRAGIEEVTGSELVGEDHADLADVVVLWFREDDGDLIDALSGAVQGLEDSGAIWLCTPKSGRDGYVDPGDISEAATSAGLARATSLSVAPHWSGTRMVSPKTRR
ncbi:DUF3052 domain-containing protein [Streptomyces sp. NPDC002886]|uniref:DUF3052 domain-containing protein n=1 Tax=Streptomyces sp. NPDC002886 TaxID=3364667 RepID=UPI00369A7F3A